MLNNNIIDGRKKASPPSPPTGFDLTGANAVSSISINIDYTGQMLDTSVRPSASQYSITVNGGTPVNPQSVLVLGTYVRLNLSFSNSMPDGASVDVTYTKTPTPLKNIFTGEANAFTVTGIIWEGIGGGL